MTVDLVSQCVTIVQKHLKVPLWRVPYAATY